MESWSNEPPTLRPNLPLEASCPLTRGAAERGSVSGAAGASAAAWCSLQSCCDGASPHQAWHQHPVDFVPDHLGGTLPPAGPGRAAGCASGAASDSALWPGADLQPAWPGCLSGWHLLGLEAFDVWPVRP